MQTLQIVIGAIVVLGLVFWTSAQFEDRKWRPRHLALCRFLRQRLPAGGPLRILEEFESRVWRGRLTADGKAELWGELPLGICLDAGLDDLRRLELAILALRGELERELAIQLGAVTLCVKQILPRLGPGGALHGDGQAPSGAPDAIPEGEFGVDITDKTLRRFIAWHVLLWRDGAEILHQPASAAGGNAPAAAGDSSAAQALNRDVEKIFQHTRLHFAAGKRLILIRHQSRDDTQLAAYLEQQIRRVFGSAWEVALHG